MYVNIYLQLNTDLPKRVSVGDQRAPPFKLTSSISLAGLDDSKNDISIHPAVYTAGLRAGFIGCLRDVKVDGEYVD